VLFKEYLNELKSADDTRAEAAALSLAGLPSPEIDDALEELSGWLSSPDCDTRWWAVRAIAAISDPRTTSLLQQTLADPQACVRQCAVVGLRQHPDAGCVASLVRALEDEDPLVADLAVGALEAIGEPAVPALLDVMANGSRAGRLKAVRALAMIGDERSIPALFAALDEDSALIEYWASEGLERMGVGMTFFAPQ
jgi:HEAT repeat protein